SLDRLEPEGVDDPDRLVAELRGQRATKGRALHLARQALLIGARMGPEDRAAATVVGGARSALTRAAGAFLAIGLLAAATDLATGLRIARARSPAGQLGRHDLVEQGDADGGREQLIVELDVAHGRAGLVVQR